MKIVVIGTRGIPGIPGGVETHCQELYPRVASLEHEVLLFTRSPYVQQKRSRWRGVRLVHCFAPRVKSIEAIVHTVLAVVRARFLNPDIVHVHAVGPALLIPFAKMLGLKVVMTNHGPDYERQKWGRLAKFMLKAGEFLGGRFADEVITISSVIDEIVRKRCRRGSNIIYNGVSLEERDENIAYLEEQGIVPGRYILAVARFVPEKGLHDLIEAFHAVGNAYQLVIAGDADHETEYSRRLKRQAAQNKRIVLTGFISGSPLQQVFSHAALFVLPSYHEGLPISLLEAMSYERNVLVSDIAANREVGLPAGCYFAAGNSDDLAVKLNQRLMQPLTVSEQETIRKQILTKYDWQKIAGQTVQVYEKTRRKSLTKIGCARPKYSLET